MSKTTEAREAINRHVSTAWNILSNAGVAIPKARELNDSLQAIHEIANDDAVWGPEDAPIPASSKEPGIVDYMMGGENPAYAEYDEAVENSIDTGDVIDVGEDDSYDEVDA